MNFYMNSNASTTMALSVMMMIICAHFHSTITFSLASPASSTPSQDHRRQQQPRPKILCLHGGGGNADSMESAVANIASALPEYEFVYANGAYNSYGSNSNSYLWIRDPPGGKGQPTTDPAWADESIQALNDILEAQGPFYGILGFSQGAAFVPVYLSRVPDNTFQIAVTFCGYLTTTHLGILDTVDTRSPFGDIPHLVWMGGNDIIISNAQTRDMATKFTDPTIVESNSAYHVVPGSNDPTFGQVVSWIRDGTIGESATQSPLKLWSRILIPVAVMLLLFY